MGKRDDKVKYKGNRKSTAMLIVTIAVILLLILFILLGSTLGGWIDSIKSKSSQSSSSSQPSSVGAPSSSVQTPSSNETGSAASPDNSGAADNGYPKNETQLTSDYQLAKPVAGDTVATVTTSVGVLKFKLFPENAPLAVENFTKKAKEGYYNNTSFKKLYADQAVQSDGDINTIHGEYFADEFSVNLHNFYGALGACNLGREDTNTNQFYIITAAKTPEGIINAMSNQTAQEKGYGFTQEIIGRYKSFGGDPTLDGKFPVFGQLYEGFEALKSINSTPINEADNTLKTEIKIISVEISTY